MAMDVDALEAKHQRGFTLVELMIVVALIAILAAIVVPTFFGEVRHVRADSEVQSIFAEIGTKEANYKVENGRYADLQAHPAAPSENPQAFQATLPADWIALKIMPPQPEVRCSYSVTSGAGGDATPGAAQAAPFNLPANPTVSWWVAIALCDMDGDGTNSTYLTSSLDSRMLSDNPGH
jgi:prepilin-type N-terminal cleavage/methylation domain-containing protein